ncbi:hypothetical protein ACQ5SO_12505 [Rhodovulum sp. DZ06]|uniref:hypothetical protein n=1 Tax=Rhodovulum sp. DZ06 TaxID=3425126 RepID=UPI003D348075
MIRSDPLGVAQAIWMRAARRLLALLEKERRLLRAGALREAADLAPEKERLSQELAEPPAAPGDDARAIARELQTAAARNRLLLGASLEAVRAARARLEQIDKARRELGVYDEGGSRAPSAGAQRTHDSRA